MSAADKLVFLSARRSAFGTFGGALKKFSANDLGVIAAKAAIEDSGVPAEEIDHVIFGNVLQTSGDAIYLARHVGLRAGVRQEAGAITVNRLCGSGFESLVQGAHQLLLGESKVVLCGGSESMSQAPHVVRGARFGLALGTSPAMQDSLWECLTDTFTGMPMAITAENLAEQYKISREEADEYALTSQERWKAAQDSGVFKDELVEIEIPSRKGPKIVAFDEHPRPETNKESLARLKTVFKKDGVVTAGNASGICDGAGALVLATAEYASNNNCAPLGTLVAWHTEGVDPTIMGIGPVPAIKGVLKKTGWNLSEVDLLEVNEAFAPQYIAVERALELDRSKVNVNGGAIALGHPLAASGSRITAHLIHALRQRGGGRAIGSACIGGGQGIAVAVEV